MNMILSIKVKTPCEDVEFNGVEWEVAKMVWKKELSYIGELSSRQPQVIVSRVLQTKLQLPLYKAIALAEVSDPR